MRFLFLCHSLSFYLGDCSVDFVDGLRAVFNFNRNKARLMEIVLFSCVCVVASFGGRLVCAVAASAVPAVKIRGGTFHWEPAAKDDGNTNYLDGDADKKKTTETTTTKTTETNQGKSSSLCCCCRRSSDDGESLEMPLLSPVGEQETVHSSEEKKEDLEVSLHCFPATQYFCPVLKCI